MPAIRLQDALLELEEARETEAQLRNLFDYGTEDDVEVARLMDQMYRDEQEADDAFLEQLAFERWQRDEAERFRDPDGESCPMRAYVDAWDEWDYPMEIDS